MMWENLNRFFSSYGMNHFTCDRPLQLGLNYFGLGENYSEHLAQLGDFIGTDFLEISDYVDRIARPRLQTWDIMGKRYDWVQIDPAHKQVLEKLLDFGVVRAVFAESAPWLLHYAMGYLIADAGIYCTLTLTNQTAYALYKYGNEALQKKFLTHYLQPDSQKAWYGATFYTETQGGSDLGANLAEAVQKDNQWFIHSQDKYFASNAGIADGALVTARPAGGAAGARGLALFFVPAFKDDGTPNYLIRRLKDKLGTRAVPTGEVELPGSEAYLVGTIGHGIYQALEVLIVARLANAISAVGIARKAYLEALLYTQKRQAFGKSIIEHPLVQKDLLEMEVELEANLLLSLKAISLFNECWHEKPPYGQRFHYARFLAHIAKNMTAEMSAWVTRQAMELHGGIGFLEEFPIARWHREALITPIWEGSSNIQALDMMEVIQKKGVHAILFEEVQKLAANAGDGFMQKAISERMQVLERDLKDLSKLSGTDAQFYAKELLTAFGELINSVLLLDAGKRVHAERGDQRFARAAEIYAHKHLLQHKCPLDTMQAAMPLIHPDRPVK